VNDPWITEDTWHARQPFKQRHMAALRGSARLGLPKG
jgi:hypothetical protein